MRPATLLPYPDNSGHRPEVLRPILSDGLPFSRRLEAPLVHPVLSNVSVWKPRDFRGWYEGNKAIRLRLLIA